MTELGIYLNFEQQRRVIVPGVEHGCVACWCTPHRPSFSTVRERDREIIQNRQRYEVTPMGGCWSPVAVLHSVLILSGLPREPHAHTCSVYSIYFYELFYFLMQCTHLHTFFVWERLLKDCVMVTLILRNSWEIHSHPAFICQAVIRSILNLHTSRLFVLSLSVVLTFKDML